MPGTADRLADAYVDCGACGGDGRGCAVCCATGRLPWSVLRPATQAAVLASGGRPYRFVRVDVPLDELATALGRPTRCGNCGAGPEQLRYDPVEGWSCLSCHASDADE
jgi:hypothetical protein